MEITIGENNDQRAEFFSLPFSLHILQAIPEPKPANGSG
jgi:hypothetical protein